MKRFILNRDNQRTVMESLVEYLNSRDMGKPMEIVCKEWKKNRSCQQNRRLHKLFGMCAKESGYTIEEMKLTFKAELLEPEAWIDYKGRKMPVFQSTATMKVDELNAFMEAVENLAASWYQLFLLQDEM